MSMIGAPNNLNLDTLNVYYEDTPQDYFDIQGLNYPVSYGKHFFTISYKDVAGKISQLVHNSKILFEVKDSNGVILNSGVTDYDDISGGGPCYLWIEEKLFNLPKNSKQKIADGKAHLTIVAELDNVPHNWKNKYNIRCVFEFDIQKGFYNKSDIVFYKKPTFNISESLETDTDDARIKRSYGRLQLDNILTWGGKVDYGEIYQKSNNLPTTQYSLLDTFKINDRSSEHLVNWKRVNTNNELEGTKWVGDFSQDWINTHTEFLNYWQYTGSHSRNNLTTHLATSKENIDGLYPAMVFRRFSTNNINGFYRWISNRRTLDDEVFDFKSTVSGSLSLIVYASHNKDILNFGTSYYTGSEPNPPIEIYRKDYVQNDASSSYSTGPLVDGEYRTDLVGQYYESNQITIPSSSYYSVTIFHSASAVSGVPVGININLVNSASIQNISLKERPPIGTNPNFYNHLFPMQSFRRDDKIQYKLQFLNVDKKPVQVLSSSIDERYKKFELDSKFELTSDIKDVEGPPVIITKDDNLISGSFKVGKGVGADEHYAVIGYDASKKIMTFEKDTDPTGKGEVTDRIIFDQSGSRSSIHLSGSSGNTTTLIVSSGSTLGPYAITTNPRTLQFVGHNNGSARLFTLGTKLDESDKFYISPGTNVLDMDEDSKIGILISGSQGIDRHRVGIRKLHPEATLHVGGNLIVDGNIQSTQFTASIISSSTILTSGSTIFGDEFGSPDTHQFFGHITASGNISASNNSTASFGVVKMDSLQTPLKLIPPITSTTHLGIMAMNPGMASSDFVGRFGFVTDTGAGAGETFFRIHNSAGNSIGFSQAGTLAHFAVASDGYQDEKARVSIGKEPYDVTGNLQSSMLHVAGNITADTNITASGNISASGTITGLSASLGSVDINGGTLDGITSLTVANNIDIGSHGFRCLQLQDDSLTSGRVIFAGTSGILSDDSDLTFSGDTLSATQITSTNITASGNISSSGHLHGKHLILSGGSGVFTSASLASAIAGGSGGSGDITGVDLTGGTNISIASETGTTSGDYSATINLDASPSVTNLTATGNTIFGNAITDTHTFTGHITASGNISSSGQIAGTNYLSNGMKLFERNATTGIIAAGNGGDASVNMNNITASGNISASGTGTFSGINYIGADSFRISDYIMHFGDDNTKFGFPNNDKFKITTGGTDRYLIEDGEHKFTGPFTNAITASGNISSSGTGTFSHIHADNFSRTNRTTNQKYMEVSNNHDLEFGDIDETGNAVKFNVNDTNQKFVFEAGFVDIQGTTDATDASGDTGILRVEGGASIAKKLFVGTNLHAAAITASGNISSSGTITGNSIIGTIGTATQNSITSIGTLDDLTVTGDITANGNIVGDNSTTISGISDITTLGNSSFGNATTDTHTFNGHITASGNISSSGNVIVGKILDVGLSTGAPAITIRNANDTIGWNLATKDTVHSYFNPSADAHADTHFGIKTTTPTVALQVSGAISSSGNIETQASITASGIRANEMTSTADIILDAAGDDIFFKDGGTERFRFNLDTNPSIVLSPSSTRGTISSTGILHFESINNMTFEPAAGEIVMTPANYLEVLGNISSSAASTGSFGRVETSEIDAFTLKGKLTAGSVEIEGSNFDINGGTIQGITDLAVADGGTGVSTLTDGGVLLGSGTSAITTMAVLTDGQMIVGDGSGDPVAESGATLRTSIGVGTGDNVEFTNITATGNTVLGNATTDTHTITGHITASGNISSSGTITGNSIVGTLTGQASSVENALTVDNATLQLDSGTTYDGDDARTISVKDGGIDSDALAADISVTGLTVASITASGNISGSATSTGSFGRLEGTVDFANIVIENDEIPIAKLASDAITIAGTSTQLGGSITADTIAGQISADTISGNQINGGTIGSITISQLAGALDVNNQNITNIDVDSGTIDGTTIGGASAAAGTFTTLNATSLNVTSITSSIVTSSILQTEGSNIFGDAVTDSHTFNGHITASGNISGSGTSTGSFGHLLVAGGTPITRINVGTGLDVSNQYGPTATVNLDLTEVIATDGANRVLTSDGDGTLSGEGSFTIAGGVASFQGGAFSHGLIVNDNNEDAGFQVKGSSDDNLLRVNAQLGDKIGIGTDSPTEKLTVIGSASIAGHITASGNISSSGTIYTNHLTASGDLYVGDDATIIDDLRVQGDITVGSTVSITQHTLHGGLDIINNQLTDYVLDIDNNKATGKGIKVRAGTGNLYPIMDIGDKDDNQILKLTSPTSGYGLELTGHLSMSAGYNITGSFVGDGSGLTGISTDIDGLSALGGTGVAQSDKFIFSDAGTEKSITFSNLEDAIFGNVSGDATIAAGGALTIEANAVEGSMLNSNVAGSGLTYAGSNVDIEAAQTVISSIYNTGLIIGRAANDTTINFSEDDEIIFDAGSSEKLKIHSSGVEVTGEISGSGNLYVGSTTGAYISASAGNVEISGSGNAQFTVDGSGSFGRNTINPATTLTVQGDISASGALYGRLKYHTMITHHAFYGHASTKIAVPGPFSTNESTAPQGYTFWIAPFAGRLKKVIIYNQTTNPGVTTMGFVTGSFDSTNNSDDELDFQFPKQEITVDMVDDTNTLFRFSESIATFEAGNRLGITVDAGSSNNNWWNLTAVWEYDISDEGNF